MKRLIIAVFSALAISGCMESGNSHGVANVDLEASFVSKTFENGVHTTESGDKLKLTSLVFEIESIEIAAITTQTDGKAVEFDPDNPPAPYTNCHNGHCHSTESSNIYTYEEIKAALSGGSITSESIKADVEKELTFTAFNTPVSLPAVEIPLELGTYQQLRVNVGHVTLTAQNTTTGQEIKLSNVHSEEDHDHEGEHEDHDHDHEHEGEHTHGFSVSHPISIQVTRNGDYQQDLDFVLELDAHFLDELSEADFSELVKAHTTLEPADESHDHH